MILRGCALRALGYPIDSLRTLSGAVRAACTVPMDRLYFEMSRSHTAAGLTGQARNQFILVLESNPDYHGLAEALAALPSG